MTLQQQVLPLNPATRRDGATHRGDHLLVAEMVERGSKVLDVGCGDGDLLQLLEGRGIDGRGIELSREGVNRCVAKGLAVVQGDADTDLVNYPDDAFDYVILSQTLQATRQPKVVLENLLRIGRRAIVSFPNFGFWRMRLQHGKPAGHLVRHAEHSFLHHQGFRAALRRDQRQDGACGRARSLWPAAAGELALVVLEHVRRTGRVPAEPGGEEVTLRRHSGARAARARNPLSSGPCGWMDSGSAPIGASRNDDLLTQPPSPRPRSLLLLHLSNSHDKSCNRHCERSEAIHVAAKKVAWIASSLRSSQ
jgi:SAM-dependent methyltransferase